MALGNGTALSKAESYADDIIERLDQIIEHTEQETTRDQLRYERRAFNATGGGPDTFEFTPPPGVTWVIQKWVAQGGAGPGGIHFYLDEIQPQNRVDFSVFDASGIAVRAPADNLIYIPSGRKLILQFFNHAAGNVLAVNMLIKELAEAK